MTREQLIDVLHQRSPLFVSREAFAASLEGWEIEGVHMNGELAFITVTKGAEFHFQSMGTSHIISMRMIREFLKPLLARHGYATTTTPKSDARQSRFNRKLGFVPVREDQDHRHYRIERLP